MSPEHWLSIWLLFNISPGSGWPGSRIVTNTEY